MRLARSPATVAVPSQGATLPTPPQSAAPAPCMPAAVVGVDPAPVVRPFTPSVGGVATAASAGLLSGAPQGDAGAAAGRRRLTTGRGGLEIGVDRHVGSPCSTIAKISTFKKGLLGLTCADQSRMRPFIAFAIDGTLKSEDSFCLQDVAKLRRAVHYLEQREPRLAVCKASWGACALLSRNLGYRESDDSPRQRKRTTRENLASGSVSQNEADANTPREEFQQLRDQRAFFDSLQRAIEGINRQPAGVF